VKSAGKPGDGSLEPDGSRVQALHPKGISSGHIEPRKMYSCGHWINLETGESRRGAKHGRQQPCMRYGKYAGHHRGLRPGHAFMGVTRELGRSECFL